MPILDGVRGVVFDLDDTLYPETGFALSGLRAVAEAFEPLLGPADAVYARLLRQFRHGDRGHVFDATLREMDRPADPALIERMIAAYREHHPRIRLHADADRLLTHLRGRLATGLISDGFLAAQRNKVEALGLRTRLDAIILTDEYGREFWKPHPRAFEEVAARLSLPHAALAYVADNAAKDFVAPRQLGWTTVQVRRADGVYRDRAAPPGGQALHVVETLDDLV